MRKLLKRFLLSIYYYEKLYEHKRFFNAWWQFTLTVTYGLIVLLVVLINVIMALFGQPVNSKYYFVSTGVILLIDLLFKNRLKEKYEKLMLEQLKEVKPFPRWILYLIAIAGFLIMIYSITLIPKIGQGGIY